MQRVAFLVVVVVSLQGWSTTAEGSSSFPVSRCDPAAHICEGRCPDLPAGSDLPPTGGVCLKEMQTGACVCWLKNDPRRHLRTLFKCEVHLNNGSVRHVMCLPPSACFPPSSEAGPGCLIVPHCPCAATTPTAGLRWLPVAALILRSDASVEDSAGAAESEKDATAAEGEKGDSEESESREFGPRHLLFLLAFVVAPLLCWCLLTFFNGSRCRKRKRRRRRSTRNEEQPLPPVRTRTRTSEDEELEEASGRVVPTAPPKLLESPPPYDESHPPVEPDCGPPPSYEDAIRGTRWPEEEEDFLGGGGGHTPVQLCIR